MRLQIPKNWHPKLAEELNKPYFLSLQHFVEDEYNNHTCYPDSNAIFSALEKCPFSDFKVFFAFLIPLAIWIAE